MERVKTYNCQLDASILSELTAKKNERVTMAASANQGVLPSERSNEEERHTQLERCHDLAKSKDILALLDQDLRKNGFAGSTAISQLVFLSLYTRVFKRPVSMLIKGASGSGKSFALKAGKQYVPDTAYEEFHGMSERALLYLPDLKLKHRYLIIQEAAGFDRGIGRVYLRQLMSEDRVNYATVQNTAEGNVGKRLPPLEGPVGVMMTTTASELHPEDETRFLSVQVEDSPDRIKEALRKQAAGETTNVKPRDLSSWHALHDYVCSGPIAVDIPYAETLAAAMPSTDNRVQRDFAQVLSLILAHALLHQITRERGNNGEVIATLDDYAAVHDLIAEPLAEGLEATVPAHIKRVVEAVGLLSDEETKKNPILPGIVVGVSQRAVADKLGINPSSVSRAVREATRKNYLIDQSPGQGREATLMIGERELPNGQALPTPDELAEAIKNGPRVAARDVPLAPEASSDDEATRSGIIPWMKTKPKI